MVEATATAVEADADRQSYLLDQVNPFTGGYDGKNFALRSEDGNFLLHPWLQLQVRNVTNYRQDGKNFGTHDDTQNGFELRRAKFGFDGNLFSPDLTYLFDWATTRSASTASVKSGSTTLTVNQGNGGVPVLEEGWVKYQLPHSSFGLQIGQIKDPLVHESLMSSKKLLAAERSVLTDVFTGGDNFVQAATLNYGTKTDRLHASLAYTDGINSSNNNFQDTPAPPGSGADYGVAARAEFTIFGDYSDYDSFSTLGLKKNLLILGGGADYTEYGSKSQLTSTADAQLKLLPGLSIYGAIEDRYIQAATTADYNEYGILGQVAYLVTPKFEVFGRYDYIRFNAADTAIPAGFKRDFHEITAGVNYYFRGHSSKLTLDGVYLPNGSPLSDSGADILANRKNEFILRLQYQLLI